MKQQNNPVRAISRAPANLMLLGEHSVVYGHPALACAVNQFIEIEWQVTDDAQICIASTLADYACTLQALKDNRADHPKLRFVIEALKAFSPYLQHGLLITIRSEFSATVGLGSSAAVLASALHGLSRITQQPRSTLELFNTGLQIIQSIQGRGSGTDLAASLSGGVIFFEPAYQGRDHHITLLPASTVETLPLVLLYSGYKTPTSEVLQQVAENWRGQPELLSQLYDTMGKTTQNAYQALKSGHTDDFYRLCGVYQGLMDALGVNDRTMSELIYGLRSCRSVLASKISGSGLGDCVLGFGSLDDCPQETEQRLKSYPQLEAELSPAGAITEIQTA